MRLSFGLRIIALVCGGLTIADRMDTPIRCIHPSFLIIEVDMRVPSIGEIWRPSGAKRDILYLCVQRNIIERNNTITTIYKFERLNDGERIYRDKSDITRWVFVQ